MRWGSGRIDYWLESPTVPYARGTKRHRGTGPSVTYGYGDPNPLGPSTPYGRSEIKKTNTTCQVVMQRIAWAFTPLQSLGLNRASPIGASSRVRPWLKAANSPQWALTGHSASQIPRVRIENFIQQLKHDEGPGRVAIDWTSCEPVVILSKDRSPFTSPRGRPSDDRCPVTSHSIFCVYMPGY